MSCSLATALLVLLAHLSATDGIRLGTSQDSATPLVDKAKELYSKARSKTPKIVEPNKKQPQEVKMLASTEVQPLVPKTDKHEIGKSAEGAKPGVGKREEDRVFVHGGPDLDLASAEGKAMAQLLFPPGRRRDPHRDPLGAVSAMREKQGAGGPNGGPSNQRKGGLLSDADMDDEGGPVEYENVEAVLLPIAVLLIMILATTAYFILSKGGVRNALRSLSRGPDVQLGSESEESETVPTETTSSDSLGDSFNEQLKGVIERVRSSFAAMTSDSESYYSERDQAPVRTALTTDLSATDFSATETEEDSAVLIPKADLQPRQVGAA